MGPGPGAGHPLPPASTAAVEEVEGGARLIVTPKDPAELASLQSFVRSRAEHLQTTGCAAMHGGR
jgi:hypothetical protein